MTTVLAASLALVALPPGRVGKDTAFVAPSLESRIRAAEATLDQAGSSHVPIRPLPPAPPVPPREAPRVGAAAVLVENFDTGTILYVDSGYHAMGM